MKRLGHIFPLLTACFFLFTSSSLANALAPGTTIDRQNRRIAEHALPAEVLLKMMTRRVAMS